MLHRLIRFSYIDSRRFKDADSVLQVYTSKEGRNIKLMNVFYAGILGFNVWSYYDDTAKMHAALDDLSVASYKSSIENTQLIIFAVAIGMGMFYYKTSHTLKQMWLEQNGRSVFLETYNAFGFRSKVRQVDVQNFRGFHYYLHQSLHIPTFKYTNGGYRTRVFFKHQFVLEEDVMKEILLGRDIKIKSPDMLKELSSQQKKKYNL